MRAYCYKCREDRRLAYDNRVKRGPHKKDGIHIDTDTLTPHQIMNEINKNNTKKFKPRPPKKHKPIDPKWLERNYK